MKKLLNLSDSFWKQDRKIYFYNQEGGKKIGGYWTHEGSFTVGAIPKAGHFAPANNYEATKYMVDDFVNHSELKCKDPDLTLSNKECRVVEQMCKAMNNCN